MESWTKGDEFGLKFPTSPEALKSGGAEFLTKAFHATGTLSKDNAVTSLTDFKEIIAGGMGRKAAFSVTYAKPVSHLHTYLFAKFEIDEANPLHAIYAGIMTSEIHFALLSRNKGFPVKVPKCYYADVQTQNRKGVLITEAIAFGQSPIEPGIEKAKDYLLENPADYYCAIAAAMGELAAFDKKGGIAPHIAKKIIPQIGKPPVTDLSLEDLTVKAESLAIFIDNNPWCFGRDVWDETVRADLVTWLPQAAKGYEKLTAFLSGHTDLNAITHWNANLDNAWFWTDTQGQKQAGLLDWGNVGPINLGMAYATMMVCAETEFLQTHGDTVIEALLTRYESRANLSIDRQVFTHCMNVGQVISGIDMTLELPGLITGSHPEFESYKSKMDSRLIEGDFLGRVLTRCLLVYLSYWKHRSTAKTLSQILS